ncbi:hypothetical protein CONPUDRAFT_165374 [Coniophora puteana RWD-64-598 SS2]|uniref:C2H2-type domain-containing protein n=1 Tax=Coniophora puteana (strain RWD-64-598) TaxID=741705 RepID=A0A5M3MQ14_CONPW|nr:uncharacterized protein CONPUDRAFT_165374 [Coniophora puteana RWD-64-598 SS2]EIW81160.1 hypothetical protein CONPUDRAFT_165374 [Coniophora puteana RWD-64-598 SS2]
MSSELSLTFSISELLRFCVSFGSANDPSSLRLDPAPTDLSHLASPELDALPLAIKIETLVVDGQRRLRVRAGQKEEAIPCKPLPTPMPTQPSTPLLDAWAAPSTSTPTAYIPPQPQLDNMNFPTTHHQTDIFSCPDMFFDTAAMFCEPSVPYLSESTAAYDYLSEQPKIHDSLIDASKLSNYSNDSPSNHGLVVHIPEHDPAADCASPVCSPASSCHNGESAETRNETTEPVGPKRRPLRFPCLHDGCPRKFSSEYTLNLHMTTHQYRDKPKVRYPCEMGCSETFSRQHDRLRHEVAKHGRMCQWFCSRCRRVFSRQSTRDKHRCSDVAGPMQSESPVQQAQ